MFRQRIQTASRAFSEIAIRGLFLAYCATSGIGVSLGLVHHLSTRDWEKHTIRQNIRAAAFGILLIPTMTLGVSGFMFLRESLGMVLGAADAAIMADNTIRKWLDANDKHDEHDE